MSPSPEETERNRPGFAGLLGFARRRSAVVVGVAAVRDSIRSGRARLVLTAADAAPGQLKKLGGALEQGGVPHRQVPSQVMLGASVGRGPLSAAAVTDAPLAEALVRRMDE